MSPWKEDFEMIRENAGIKSLFSPFTTEFSAPSKREIIILASVNLSSADAFNLLWLKMLSFGKELTHYQSTNFRLFQTERVCR